MLASHASNITIADRYAHEWIGICRLCGSAYYARHGEPIPTICNRTGATNAVQHAGNIVWSRVLFLYLKSRGSIHCGNEGVRIHSEWHST